MEFSPWRVILGIALITLIVWEWRASSRRVEAIKRRLLGLPPDMAGQNLDTELSGEALRAAREAHRDALVQRALTDGAAFAELERMVRGDVAHLERLIRELKRGKYGGSNPIALEATTDELGRLQRMIDEVRRERGTRD